MSAIQSQHSQRSLSRHSEVSSSDSEVEILSRKGKKMSGGKLAGIIVGSVAAGVALCGSIVVGTHMFLANGNKCDGNMLTKKGFANGVTLTKSNCHRVRVSAEKKWRKCRGQDDEEEQQQQLDQQENDVDPDAGEVPTENADGQPEETSEGQSRGWCCNRSKGKKASDSEEDQSSN